MDVRHLAVFHQVLRSGSISGAAREMGVSQPAVSKSLKLLERRFGFALFVRSNAGLGPTPEAERLIPELERIFGGVQRLQGMVESVRRGEEGDLRVAGVPSLALGMLGPAIAEMAIRRPRLGVSFLTMLAHQVHEWVLTRRIELGFTFTPADHPDLTSEVIDRCALVALVPRAHALCEHEVVTPADLATTSVIAFGADRPLGMALDAVLREHHVRPRRRLEIGHSFVAWTLVARGAGIAIVDPYVLRALHTPEVNARPFHPSIEIATWLTRRRDVPISVAGRELLAQLREHAAATPAVTARAVPAPRPPVRRTTRRVTA